MSAQHKYRRRWRTDWFRVLVDLQAEGWPNSRVADEIAVPQATLRGWKQGSEPAHVDGHRLLRLWMRVTRPGQDGQDAYDDRPMVED